MNEELETAVRTAEKKRCDAMLANDGAALDKVLDERLMFHHATGAVDDKAAYLAKIAGGRIRYAAIAWAEEKVTPLAENTALLTGMMITDVAVEGSMKRLNNRVMTVWQRAADSWRMVAFQSTPLAG